MGIGRMREGFAIMKNRVLTSAVALGCALVASSAALADDPRDAAMQSRSARERDAAEVRRLNREQLRYVQERDARYAKGWQAYRDYPAKQAEYERAMAEWRRAVKLCEDGHHEYCAR
jgi:hypothetical protein